MTAYRTKHGEITFKQGQGVGLALKIPCGQCVGCRLERSRQWAIRCVHEAQMHVQNCFITLTYDEENIPSGGTLNKKHFQDFMKRVRYQFPKLRIRYYHCGEYGSQTSRPHYHALLFGLDFQDKILLRDSRGVKLYTSETLQKLWPYGHSSIGDVTFESAAYVARYVMKKVTGKAAKSHYEKVIPETGEIISILPEYTSMSLKPGIGSEWFNDFKSDVFPDDFVVLKGKKLRPPRYYEKLYDIQEAEKMDSIKLSRKRYASTKKSNNTPERLAVRAKVLTAKVSQLKREVD